MQSSNTAQSVRAEAVFRRRTTGGKWRWMQAKGAFNDGRWYAVERDVTTPRLASFKDRETLVATSYDMRLELSHIKARRAPRAARRAPREERTAAPRARAGVSGPA